MKFNNILLIQPMHEKAEKKERTSFNFPWGIAWLAKYIKDAGFNVLFLDGQVLQLPKEELAPLIDSYDVNIIGISAFSTQFNAVRYLSDYIKSKRNVPIIVGGPLATYQPNFALQNTKADICVIGEGEFTVIDLLKGFDRIETVKGIAYKKNGSVFKNAPQDKLVSLDELPVPDFDIFDIQKYLHQQNAYSRKAELNHNAITFMTSRGCPYSCHFCSKSSRNYRSMSPQKMYEWIYLLKKEFNVQEISFGDELFLASKKRFLEFSPMLKSLNVLWGAQARINHMDDEFLGLIKESGCVGVGYGIESGSQKILNNMNKNIKVEQIEEIMKKTMELKIPVKVQLIFGYPGEDESTVSETIDLFKRIDHPGRRFNVVTPIPGSKLYDDCISHGIIKDEVKYLCDIEKSFGIGKVHVNFTKWPDDEIYPKKRAAEEEMKKNYINNSIVRRTRHFIGRLKRRLVF